MICASNSADGGAYLTSRRRVRAPQSLLKILPTSLPPAISDNDMMHDGSLDVGALLLAKLYRKVDLPKMIRIAPGHFHFSVFIRSSDLTNR